MSTPAADRPSTATLALHGLGLFSALCYATMAWLNREAQTLGLLAFFPILALAWIDFLLAYRVLRSAEPSLHSRAMRVAIVVWPLIFRLIGLWARPVMEDDYYRYLWDGRQLAVTGNPYATSPSDHFQDATLGDPFSSILDRINYPHIPTLYGPVLQYFFGLSYGAGPGQLWPLKLLLLLADAFSALLLYRMAGLRALLLFAWCPLLVQETGFTAHPDSFGVFFTLAALAGWQRSRAGLTSLGLGFAAGSKVLGGLLWPFFLKRRPIVHAAGALLVFGSVYFPFWIQGSWADWPVLARFAREWEFNSGGFAILKACLGPSTAPGMAGLLTAAGLGWIWWRWKPSSPLPGDLVYGWFFLWSAVVQPWYLLWLLPWVVLRPSYAGWAGLVSVSLSYIVPLHFGGDSADVFAHPVWVRPLEYGLVAAALMADAAKALSVPKLKSTPALREGGSW